MFVDRLDDYKIDNLRIMTKEMCKYNLEMKTCHLVPAKYSAGMLNAKKVNELMFLTIFNYFQQILVAFKYFVQSDVLYDHRKKPLTRLLSNL
jgi:hypothetical protein